MPERHLRLNPKGYFLLEDRGQEVQIDWQATWHTWQVVVGGHIWPFLNTNFVSALVPSIVGLLLTRRVAEVVQANRDSEEIRSAEASAARMESVSQSSGDTDRAELIEDAREPLDGIFPQLSEKFEQIRSKLEVLITSLDGRRKRKYKRLTRYDYGPIILLLGKDDKLSPELTDDLFLLHTDWRPFSKRKPTDIPTSLVERIRNFDVSRLSTNAHQRPQT